MLRFRIATTIAAFVSLITATLYIGTVAFGLTIDRTPLGLLAAVSLMSSVVLLCSYHVIRTMLTVRRDILEGVADETRHLHRAVAGVIEQYGDIRAINAVIANERRHCTPPAQRGEDTADLKTVGSANVTRIRPR